MVRIEIEEDVARVLEHLRARAAARGISFDAYLRELADGETTPDRANGNISLAELDGWLDELSAGTEALPSLPLDFSRADIYGDHD